MVYGTIISNQGQHLPKFKQSWNSPFIKCIPGTRPGVWVSLCEMQTLPPSTPKLRTGNEEGKSPLRNAESKEQTVGVDTQSPLSWLTLLHSGSSIHGVVLPTSIMGLPSSHKPLYKQLNRHTRPCVSWVILNPITLTIKNNTHKYVIKTTRHFKLYRTSKGGTETIF